MYAPSHTAPTEERAVLLDLRAQDDEDWEEKVWSDEDDEDWEDDEEWDED